MPPNLSPALQQYLVELRAQPLFRELLLALPQRSVPRFRRRKRDNDVDDQFSDWIYHSGKVDERNDLLLWLLGYEQPDNAQ
jgi:hypothetical protein